MTMTNIFISLVLFLLAISNLNAFIHKPLKISSFSLSQSAFKVSPSKVLMSNNNYIQSTSSTSSLMTTDKKTTNPFIPYIVSLSFFFLFSFSSPLPSFAKVGEGDLPDGAMAQQRLLKYQNEWSKLHDSVSNPNNKVDDKEVLTIKLFLKQLANEYYDMELLSTSITDTSKSKEAKSIAKSFRTKIRDIDDSMNNGQVGIDKIISNYGSTANDITEFLKMLQDVPDEL